MMRLALLLALFVFSFHALGDYTVTPADLDEDPEGMPGERAWEKDLTLGDDLIMRASMSVTNKGNGSLRIGNLSVRVYDSHNDGFAYKNNMLLVEFTDVNGDGYLDLVVTGIYLVMSETLDDMIIEQHPVCLIALLDPKTGKFTVGYTRKPAELETLYKVD